MIKLADFGIARVMSSDTDMAETRIGTIEAETRLIYAAETKLIYAGHINSAHAFASFFFS